MRTIDNKSGKVFLKIIEIGYHRISIYLTNGTGGSITPLPHDDEGLVMHIGIHEANANTVIHTYLHECLEFAYWINGNRYSPDNVLCNSHDRYLFMFTHPQFASSVYDCCENITEMVQLLNDKWKEYNEEV